MEKSKSKNNFWSPWHGCHKCSPGCLNCYVYYLDGKRDKDASIVTKSKTNFNLPLKKTRTGEYKIPSGSEVATCFTSDFFIEEADAWRADAWEIIKKRSDVTFLISTKRIERFNACIPEDWDNGYPNVIIAVTCETQKKADERIPILLNIKASKKYIFATPLLEEITFAKYLENGELDLISVGGESYENARICDFTWIEKIYKECIKYNVSFDFHQTGSNFKIHDKIYKIKHFEEYNQAKKGKEYLRKSTLKEK